MKTVVNFKRVVYPLRIFEVGFSEFPAMVGIVMEGKGTVLSVHSYSRYVDEGAFVDIAEELAEDFPVYGVRSSENSGELLGDFYEDSFEDIDGGKNGYINPRNLESLEPPFYVIGGLVSECVPGTIESVLKSGEEAYIVEEGVFERFEDKFLTYGEMNASEQSFSDIFRNLNDLGAPSVRTDEFLY